VHDALITENFLLQNDAAVRLYHEYARDMPIIDYHCHLPPGEIAEDRRFENLTQIWLYGDHYKWRAMRAEGVPERYLTGGAKVYAFHTLDLQTRACAQTISTDKSYATVRGHALKTWKTLGIPDGLQMDNDGAFCGGYKAPRIFGQFVRLCLYLGIEPIFIPFGEPERNGEVERVNGLWSSAFWKRRRFRSVAHVVRASPEFEAWYAQHYTPPKLEGRTPAQAQRQAQRRRLTARQIRALPKTLPLTEGRLHFLRLVSAEGAIVILNETWHVHKRLAGQYVWATLWTHQQRLDIYYRRSLHVKARLLKTYYYAMPESVLPLRPEFKHRRRRRKMGTML